MQGIYTKLLERYRAYLPAQKTHVRVGDRVLRDWFAVLSVALTIFVVLVLVGAWVYISALHGTTSQSTMPATSPMPLDRSALERVDRMSNERAAAFRQSRTMGFTAPDPGRATTPVIIVDEDPSETEDEE
jgi:hypothetical protein